MPSGELVAKNWQEIRKGGGKAPDRMRIREYLERDDDRMLSRDELIERIDGYFGECIERVYDADSGRAVDVWVKAPTKNGLARAIGIEHQTLIDYVHGLNSVGKPYTGSKKAKVDVNDFPIIRKAVEMVEEYYEGLLSGNRNNAGTIFWLKNARGSNWTDDRTLLINEARGQNRQNLMSEEVDTQKLQDKYRAFLLDSEASAKDD